VVEVRRPARPEFLTGYLIEKSLSVDNIFVFVVVFGALASPPSTSTGAVLGHPQRAHPARGDDFRRHGAAGTLPLAHLRLGAFLVLTGLKLSTCGRRGRRSIRGERPHAVGEAVIPTSKNLDGNHFFTVENGKRLATPLFLALVLIEFTDVIFALDSIPGHLRGDDGPVHRLHLQHLRHPGPAQPLLLLAGMVDKFSYLKVGLSGVLVFVG
jgi:tellurite resistance protein TerC